jgi:hypothetical protein
LRGNFVKKSLHLSAFDRSREKSLFQILERMEKILLSFQSDLGSISNEILTLQQESVEVRSSQFSS